MCVCVRATIYLGAAVFPVGEAQVDNSVRHALTTGEHWSDCGIPWRLLPVNTLLLCRPCCQKLAGLASLPLCYSLGSNVAASSRC